jgi:hypothetical protein
MIDENDEDSHLCEHLFTKANATLNPGKPTTLLLCRTVTEEFKDKNRRSPVLLDRPSHIDK